MADTPARTRITHRSYRCRGPLQHSHRFKITLRSSDDSLLTTYELLGSNSLGPLALPVCPICNYLCDDIASFSGLARVPESERFAAWLALDGSYLSVPGNRDAKMPARYEGKAIRVEGYGIRDLDRLDAIRARQTGNDCYNEFNYSGPERRFREEVEYDPDDMRSEI